MKRQYHYFIQEMHCNSCKLLVNDALASLGLKNSTVNLKTKEVSFFSTTPEAIFFPKLQKLLAEYHYTLSKTRNPAPKSLAIPLLISTAIIFLFLSLEKIGLSRLFNPQTITFPAIFLIGVIASLSSCMVVVGSLVLSLSTTKANLVSFHFSRLIGFLFLGIALGFLGQFLLLTPSLQTIINLVFSFTLLFLGLSQLDILPSVTLPGIFGRYLFKIKHTSPSYPALPVILGAGTFFLPCGFTQSMQLYSLTLKNPLQSGLTMFTFSLGTLPVLAGISLLSRNLQGSKYLLTFQKTTALLIVFFALFLLYHLLA